jgi:hypothetical protein
MADDDFYVGYAPSMPTATRRFVRRAVAAAFAAAIGLAAAGWAPWLAPAVFLAALARSGWGLSSGRCPIRPQRLGLRRWATAC